jgi:transposase
MVVPPIHPAIQAIIDELRAENEALKKQLKAALDENAELRRRLGMNSSNSSKPPSSDPPWAPASSGKKKKKKRKRKRGAQKGHRGHHRELLPEERVDHVVDCRPSACKDCGTSLSGKGQDPQRHQVLELVDGRIVVTEYRLFKMTCRRCGAKSRGELPAGVMPFLLGPRLTALVALLTGKYRLSKRNTSELLFDLFGIELCIGTISAAEKRMSAALAGPVREAEEFIRQQDIVHADETGWKERGKRAWLWVAVTALVVVFKIAFGRDTAKAKALLGKDFSGRVVTDQLGSYGWVDASRRQLCWAHLQRKFRSWSERDGEIGRYGGLLLKESKKLFRWWGCVRDGTLSRDDFRIRMTKRLIPRFEKLLIDAALTELPVLSRACTDLANESESLWVFVHHEGIDPTNNNAERALRHAVIWRKTSFGTQSSRGSRFVERMLTVVSTLRLQRRPVLQFLSDAFSSCFSGAKPPSLLCHTA